MAQRKDEVVAAGKKAAEKELEELKNKARELRADLERAERTVASYNEDKAI